jgi:hypothetical protein
MAEKQRAKGDGGEREEGAATSAEIATRPLALRGLETLDSEPETLNRKPKPESVNEWGRCMICS